MDVHDGLAGALVAVDAEVVAVGRIFLVDELFALVQKVVHRLLLFGRYVEVVLHVALRDYQKMPRIDGHHVEYGVSELVFEHVVFQLAEYAVHDYSSSSKNLSVGASPQSESRR